MKLNYIRIHILILATFFACKTDRELTVIDKSIDDNTIVVSSEQFNAMNITLGSVSLKQVPEVVRVNGVIDVPPENKVVVSAVRGGYLKSAPPIVGSTVSKGDLIVSIESPEIIELQQNYLETAQQLKFLKYEYDRHLTMKAENVISEKSFRKSENDFKTTEARFNGLKKQLELLNLSPSEVEKGIISSSSNIFSPISGTVTKVEVSKGSYISPEREILEIVNNDHIHLELVVYEKDILKIKEGQSIKFKIPESSEISYSAKVYLVNNTIDENRTVRVHAHLEDEDEASFIVGMFVEAEIETEGAEMNTLPTPSIIDLYGNPQILILDEVSNRDYIFKRMDIEVGETYKDFTSIEKRSWEHLDGKIAVDGIEPLTKL